jgi:prepilin-type N-terminal cleavage/methylation domain-containing protein
LLGDVLILEYPKKYFDGKHMVKRAIQRFLCNGQQTTNDGQSHGFTLLELIVVITLLGIMLVFTVPRFHDTLFLDGGKKGARWIIGKVRALKEAAIQNQKNYTLHIDLDTQRYWETDESMSTEDRENAALNAVSIPGDLTIADIEYPIRGKINSGQADIRFYKTGYTDKLLIHLQDDAEYVSFLIEPFLSEVTQYETYAGFDD